MSAMCARRSCRRHCWWYRVGMAWRWLTNVEHLSVDEAQAQLKNLVKGLRQYGVRGGPVSIGEHEPEVVVISRSRHELLMDLLERHGALEELAEAERHETPSEADLHRVASELDIELPAPVTR